MKVIMPVYIVNEEILELTKRAIFSMGEIDQLIIIDNDSEIGGGYLRALADIYVKNKSNLGYAKAVNQGLKLVNQDEYVAVANNDIKLSPNWRKVVENVFSEPKVYTCHLRMTNYDEPIQYGSKVVYEGMERWCSGSFFIINTHYPPIFYDEKYLNSYDDWDYFHAIRQAGFKTAYTDKACYQHKHSTTQQLIPDREKNNQKNREYFKKKWGEYPEDLYTKLYPDQMKKDYYAEFNL